MSHADKLSKPPPDFHVIGHTQSAPYAAIAHNSKPFYGIQFHPEVTHTPNGKAVIGKFILDICGCKQSWTMVSYIDYDYECFIFFFFSYVHNSGRIYWERNSTNS